MARAEALRRDLASIDVSDPQLYQNFARWHDLHLEQERWKKDLERLTARWGGLSQELEGIKQKLEVEG